MNAGFFRCGLINAGFFRCGLINAGFFRCGLINAGLFRCGLMNAGFFRCGLINAGFFMCSLINAGLFRCGLINAGLFRCGLINAGFSSSGKLQCMVDELLDECKQRIYTFNGNHVGMGVLQLSTHFINLASGGSPIFPLVVHQPPSPPICPAVPSLRRGLSINKRSALAFNIIISMHIIIFIPRMIQ